MKMNLIIPLVQDQVTRENFQRVADFFATENQLLGFKHYELTFSQAVTDFTHPHGLKFVPKDVIQTSLIGSGAITFNYAKFNRDTISITTTGPCVVRFYLGTYGG